MFAGTGEGSNAEPSNAGQNSLSSFCSSLILVRFGIRLNLLIHQVPILQFLSGAPLSHRGPIPGGCPGHRAARAGALGQVGATHLVGDGQHCYSQMVSK